MKTYFLILIALLPSLALAQSKGTKGTKGKGMSEMPALKVNQPAAPAGFDVARSGIARGKVEPVEFVSKESGTFRLMIYTPAGVQPHKKLPALYLLHGASGDENTWIKEIHADAILDNLYAGKKLAPMYVIMPSMLSVSGREQAGNSREAMMGATMAFSDVLMNEMIPFLEKKHSVSDKREHRALAGLSMGAGVAFSTGLRKSDHFAWIGAFSGSGSTRRLEAMRMDLKSKEREPRLVWLSVGDRDELMAGGMVAADAFLTAKAIPHEFRINSGGHEPKVWMNDLYHFAPLLFQNANSAR